MYVGDLTDTTGWKRVRDEEGMGVMTYGMNVSGVVASYVNLEHIGCTTPTIAQRVVALARGLKGSSAMETGLSDVYGFADVSSIHSMTRTPFKEINDVLPHVPIASSYHLHINPQQAYMMCVTGRNLDLANAVSTMVMSINGMTQASLSTWLIWASNAPEELVRGIVSAITHAQYGSVSALTKYLKGLTIRAKQLQHSIGFDLAQVFEVEVLVNRGVGSVDWAEEEANRTTPNVVEIPEETVFRAAVSIFKAGQEKGYKYQRLDLDNWWSTRWLHVPNGSAHTRSTQLSLARDKVRKVEGFSKKMLLSSLSKLDAEQLFASTPGLDAWPSVKYEWGKQRAIYGTDLEGFIMADLAYPQCEQAVPSSIVIGDAAEENKVKATVELMSHGTMPFCFDYEDFNSQHSARSMRAVLAGYRAVFGSLMSPEQLKAAIWTEQSLGNMVVHANEAMGVRGYKASDTLLSGWRLTTLVNSVLNRIYLQASGALESALYTIHSGDDVLASCVDVAQSETFLRRARAFGIRAQASKAATGSIAEFLRIDHRGERTNSQYLTRSCSTVVHSRIESRRAETMQAMVTACESRISDMYKRGASPKCIQAIRYFNDKRTEKTFDLAPGTCELFRTTHPLEGGMTVTVEPSGRRIVNVPIEHRAAKTLDIEEEIKSAFAPGAYDVSAWIAGKIGNRSMYNQTLEEVFKASLDSCLLVRRKVEVRDYPVTASAVRDFTNYRCWHRAANVGLGNVIKGLSLSLVKIAAGLFNPIIMKRLQESSDPLHTAVVCL